MTVNSESSEEKHAAPNLSEVEAAIKWLCGRKCVVTQGEQKTGDVCLKIIFTQEKDAKHLAEKLGQYFSSLTGPSEFLISPHETDSWSLLITQVQYQDLSQKVMKDLEEKRAALEGLVVNNSEITAASKRYLTDFLVRTRSTNLLVVQVEEFEKVVRNLPMSSSLKKSAAALAASLVISTFLVASAPIFPAVVPIMMLAGGTTAALSVVHASIFLPPYLQDKKKVKEALGNSAEVPSPPARGKGSD
ncbi:MAG: hypothetical protein K0S27_1472 [Gammaproteobacteria bacterium]|jgi:hypothetical protein|nr:hypothetical protein [Gammaproteobacteria bacterium]